MKLDGHTLVLGGARSGKTRHALALAETRARRVYIATAEAWDDEMADRIQRHKAERGDGWSTLEAPLELAAAAQQAEALLLAGGETAGSAIVIDCLTLWLSNLMHHERDVDAATVTLIAGLRASAIPVVLVSNETGLGIVPDNRLARRFRDAQGTLNQRIAAAVPHVVFVAAGLPLTLKG